MQHFSTNELVWLEEYMNEELPWDLPANTITHLRLHSDNAGTHFKRTGAME